MQTKKTDLTNEHKSVVFHSISIVCAAQNGEIIISGRTFNFCLEKSEFSRRKYRVFSTRLQKEKMCVHLTPPLFPVNSIPFHLLCCIIYFLHYLRFSNQSNCIKNTFSKTNSTHFSTHSMPLQPAQLPHHWADTKKVAQFSNKKQVHSAYVMPIVHAPTRPTSNVISVMSPSPRPMNSVDMLSEEGN